MKRKGFIKAVAGLVAFVPAARTLMSPQTLAYAYEPCANSSQYCYSSTIECLAPGGTCPSGKQLWAIGYTFDCRYTSIACQPPRYTPLGHCC